LRSACRRELPALIVVGALQWLSAMREKKIRLPGSVWYVLPIGDFQITVPSGDWWSAQPQMPVQNVFSRW